MKLHREDAQDELEPVAAEAPPEESYSLEEIMREFGGWSKPAEQAPVSYTHLLSSCFWEKQEQHGSYGELELPIACAGGCGAYTTCLLYTSRCV